jgi:lipopolysaccharide transport system permease protein
MAATVTAQRTQPDTFITAKSNLSSYNFKDLWRYKDLIAMFIRRDIVTVYKQTILGPIWFVVQPLLTSLMYLLIFAGIAGLKTNDVPPILFYLIGTTLWGYFSDTLNVSAKTFTDNAAIFGKVYFPRIVAPISKTVSGLIKFFIQFALFTLCWLYFLSKGQVHPNTYMLLSPVLLLIISLQGLGFGLLITSLTTKYRDLNFLVSFGVQLAMYATPVIIPLSDVKAKYRLFFDLNPLTSVFEAFKLGFLGKGVLEPYGLLYSTLFTFVLLILGLISFSRVEKRFIDIV